MNETIWLHPSSRDGTLLALLPAERDRRRRGIRTDTPDEIVGLDLTQQSESAYTVVE